MRIYHDITNFPLLEKPIVTVGTFDGVHRGHQEIFWKMKLCSQQSNFPTVAITFDPHPRLALNPDNKEVKLINIPRIKYERIAATGIDYLLILPFTKEFSLLSPDQFVRNYLVEKLHIGTLVIGYDHHFGNNRKGDFLSIEQLGQHFEFDVIEIKSVNANESAISSTLIRNLLREGNVKLANQYLGYEYSITGQVIHGNNNGRKIGFPTANLEVPEAFKLITANGVYACRVLIDGVWRNGMGNVGFRPTIPHSPLTIEVNIFDFDSDIYEKTITIAFVERIRDEIKFENLNQLRQQLERDKIAITKELSQWKSIC